MGIIDKFILYVNIEKNFKIMKKILSPSIATYLIAFLLGLGINTALYCIWPIENKHTSEIPDYVVALGIFSFVVNIAYGFLILRPYVIQLIGEDVYEGVMQDWFGENESDAAVCAFFIIASILQSLFIPWSFIGNLTAMILTLYIGKKKLSDA